MRHIEDLSGKSFGRWTVFCRGGTDKNGHVKWRCACVCGLEREVSGCHLKSGATKSCGCLARELSSLPRGVAAANSAFKEYVFGAARRGIEFALTVDEFLSLSSSGCSYCGSAPTRIKTTASNTGEFLCNGIDRVDNEAGYTVENCVSCCATCNRAKLAMSKSEFLAWVDRLYTHQHIHKDRSQNPISEKFWLELEAA